jgi:NAD(P)H-hydrate epimerase
MTLTRANIRFTASGLEVPAVTAEQMREVDRIAMEETGPNLFQMMENAGRNLAALSMELLEDGWQQASYLVLAGSGGNGGGGICAGRHLANHGCRVSLCLADPEHLGEVPAFQHKVFRSTSGKEIGIAELDRQRPDIILDALIGYGLKSAPVGAAVGLIEWANAGGIPILALDIPSGRNATTGEAPGACIWPRWTMTLALPKTGLLPDTTGDLFLADIGIPQETYQRMQTKYVSPFGKGYWMRLAADAAPSEKC